MEESKDPRRDMKLRIMKVLQKTQGFNSMEIPRVVEDVLFVETVIFESIKNEYVDDDKLRNMVKTVIEGDVQNQKPSEEKLLTDENRQLVLRFITLMKHAEFCTSERGKCRRAADCDGAKSLWGHALGCTVAEGCPHPRCTPTRELMRLKKL